MSRKYASLAESPESATAVWERATKRNKSSYLAWTNYAEALVYVASIAFFLRASH
jgi:hypothetical protein